jgi:hypothetical protein
MYKLGSNPADGHINIPSIKAYTILHVLLQCMNSTLILYIYSSEKSLYFTKEKAITKLSVKYQ